MQKYKNLSGKSGIAFYEIFENSILVQFSDGAKYIYSYQKTGKPYVEHMKKLAESGIGLHRFINSSVRDRYETRIK